MVPGKSLTDKAHLLRQWGFGGVSVFADAQTWDDEKLEELIHLEEKTGIAPCEFLFMSTDAGKLMSRNKAEREATQKLYTKAAEVCAKIGAITEIEYLYGAQDPLPLFDIYRQMNAEEEMAFLNAYRAILKPVIGTKGRVLIEGINRYESPYMNSIMDCKKIVDKVGVKEVGVLADFFHMSIEESNISESLLAMNGSIAHVHLGDNNRRMPGCGSIDWEAGFRALKAQNYNGFINFECSTMGNPEKAIPESAAFINAILKKV